MTLDDIIKLIDAGYTKADIDKFVSFQNTAPIEGEPTQEPTQEPIQELQQEPQQETQSSDSSKIPEGFGDIEKYMKSINEKLNYFARMSAETTSVSDVSKANDDAISSIISPTAYKAGKR